MKYWPDPLLLCSNNWAFLPKQYLDFANVSSLLSNSYQCPDLFRLVKIIVSSIHAGFLILSLTAISFCWKFSIWAFDQALHRQHSVSNGLVVEEGVDQAGERPHILGMITAIQANLRTEKAFLLWLRILLCFWATWHSLWIRWRTFWVYCARF